MEPDQASGIERCKRVRKKSQDDVVPSYDDFKFLEATPRHVWWLKHNLVPSLCTKLKSLAVEWQEFKVISRHDRVRLGGPEVKDCLIANR